MAFRVHLAQLGMSLSGFEWQIASGCFADYFRTAGRLDVAGGRHDQQQTELNEGS